MTIPSYVFTAGLHISYVTQYNAREQNIIREHNMIKEIITSYISFSLHRLRYWQKGPKSTYQVRTGLSLLFNIKSYNLHCHDSLRIVTLLQWLQMDNNLTTSSYFTKHCLSTFNKTLSQYQHIMVLLYSINFYIVNSYLTPYVDTWNHYAYCIHICRNQ